MKILLYYEPTICAETINETNSIDLIYTHLYKWLGENIINSHNCEIKTIVSEPALYQKTYGKIFDKMNFVALNDDEILSIFKRGITFGEIRLKIFHSRLTETEESNYINLVKSKIGLFNPDVIITFPTHNNYLNKAFPHSLVLNNENGIFSRPPFMRTLRYEPFNYINNFPNIFYEDIKAYKISNEINEKVENFKRKLVEIIDKHNPYNKILKDLKKKYQSLILLPLITDNGYEESYSNDEYIYLLDTLKSVPKDIGIIITKHDFTKGKINKKVLDYLKHKYPNIIDINCSEYNSYGSASIHFYKYVDAIINCMTSTGLQATLWDTKIIANDKKYSHWFSDYIGLDNIKEKLHAPKTSKNNMLYWYLTHYIVYEKHFNEPNWYYNYFKTKLDKYKKEGITFNFFEQIEDFDEIANYILDYVKIYYKSVETSTQTQKPRTNFIQKVFSVKNEGNHKVFRILGTKFKIKKK